MIVIAITIAPAPMVHPSSRAVLPVICDATATAPGPVAEQRVEECRPHQADHRQADEQDDLVERVRLDRVLGRAGLWCQQVGTGRCRQQKRRDERQAGSADQRGPGGVGSTSHRRAILYAP